MGVQQPACPCGCRTCALTPSPCALCRLKALGEGSKQWSSSAPNLGKSPKHTPMAPGFASLNEMGKRVWVLGGVAGHHPGLGKTCPEEQQQLPCWGVALIFRSKALGREI